MEEMIDAIHVMVEGETDAPVQCFISPSWQKIDALHNAMWSPHQRLMKNQNQSEFKEQRE